VSRALRTRRTIARALLVASALAGHSAPAHTGDAWAQVALPDTAQAFQIGDELISNGQRMQLRGFVAAERPEEIAGRLLAQLGRPSTDDRIGAKRVLSGVQGGHYITIQLEPAGSGTRGLIAATQLESDAATAASARDAERWRARLPAGSEMLSQVSAADRGRLWRQVVVANRHSREINRSHVMALMRQEGLSLEYESPHSPTPGPGNLMLFRGARGEGMAVIRHAGAARTSVVLHLITPSQPLP
jgi:hypothetical protein